MLEAERIRADREHRRAEDERAARLHVESELAASKETVERLRLLVKEYERARFGKRSEKFDPDQLQLVLEDIEIAIAEVQEREDDRARRSGRPSTRERAGRAARAFPAHLPRVERVIEPASLACPCGCGLMVRIGEDRSSRLDVTPAQYRVIETVRPRYACPKGCAGVAQAPAPAHLIEGGVPTEALLAQVAVAKFSEHMPLYRQSQVFARHGIMLDRAVLADWMGTTAFHLAPLVERMSALMKLSGRLFMDETTAPGARSRPRPDEDGLSLGRSARRPRPWRRRSADRGLSLCAGARRRARRADTRRIRRRPPGRRIWRLSSAGAARTQRRRAAAARLVLEPWQARDHRRHAEGGLARRRGDPRAHRRALCDRGGDQRQRGVDPAAAFAASDRDLSSPNSKIFCAPRPRACPGAARWERPSPIF